MTDKLTVIIHREDGTLWAEVPTLRGVFATGDTPGELDSDLAAALEEYGITPDRWEKVYTDPADQQAEDERKARVRAAMERVAELDGEVIRRLADM